MRNFISHIFTIHEVNISEIIIYINKNTDTIVKKNLRLKTLFSKIDSMIKKEYFCLSAFMFSLRIINFKKLQKSYKTKIIKENENLLIKGKNDENFYKLRKIKFKKVNSELQKTPKYPISKIYSDDISEYSFYKAWFDLESKRIKKFSDFWDEVTWIYKKFFAKYDFEIKNFDTVKEQFFLFFLYCQTNKNDVCHICNYLKYFPYEKKTSILYPNFIFKLLHLDQSWNEMFSEKNKKFKNHIHLGYSTDDAFQGILNNRKTNYTEKKSNVISMGRKKTHYMENNFFSSCLDPKCNYFTLISKNNNSKQNNVFESIFKLETKCNILAFFNYLSRWGKKCNESFFVDCGVKISYLIYHMSKRMRSMKEYENYICLFLLQIFIKKFRFKNSEINVEKFKLLDYYYLSSNKIHLVKKNRQQNGLDASSSFEYFFRKDVNNSTGSKILSKLLEKSNYYKNFLLMIVYKKVFLTKILKKFIKIIKNKIQKIYIDQLIFKFSVIFNNPKNLSCNEKNDKSKWSFKKICMIKLESYTKKSSSIIFTISFGEVAQNDQVKIDRLTISKKEFSKLIVQLCINRGIDLIFFFIKNTDELEIYKKFKNFILDMKYNDRIKTIKNSLKIFLENLKIVFFNKNSINYQLSKTLNAKILFGGKIERIFKTTILYLTKGLLLFSWFLTYKKKEKFLKLEKNSFKIEKNILLEIMDMVIRMKVQNYQPDFKKFNSIENRLFLMNFVCSFGVRKTVIFLKYQDKKIKSSIDRFIRLHTKRYIEIKSDIISYSNEINYHLKNTTDEMTEPVRNIILKKICQRDYVLYIDLCVLISQKKINGYKVFDLADFYDKIYSREYDLLEKNYIISKKEEELFLENMKIKKVLFARAIFKDTNYHIQGVCDKFYKFFIHKKDCFSTPKKFEKIILKKIKNFPAAIFSIYSKLQQARLILIPV